MKKGQHSLVESVALKAPEELLYKNLCAIHLNKVEHYTQLAQHESINAHKQEDDRINHIPDSRTPGRLASDRALPQLSRHYPNFLDTTSAPTGSCRSSECSRCERDIVDNTVVITGRMID